MAGEIEVTARGFLSKDAEERVTQAGTHLVQLNLAVNVTRRADGDSKEYIDVRTDWVRVSVWAQHLRAAVAGLTKGTLVVVEGHLVPGAYLDAENKPQPSIDVHARNVFIVPRAARVDQPLVSSPF